MQHLDEGTIHAWLDDQLPPDEARAVEAHVAECRQCADAVAEARGLIAASSRILMSLDSVPRDVVPLPSTPRSDTERGTAAAPVVAPRASSPASQRAQRRWFRGPSFAAAAVVVMAVGTFALMRAGGRGLAPLNESASSAPASGPMADSAVPSPAVSSGAPAALPAAPPQVAPAAKSLGAVGAAASQPRVAPAPADARSLQDAARLESSATQKVADARRESAPVAQRVAPFAATGDNRAKDGFVAPAELRRQSLAKQDSVARDEIAKVPPPAPVLTAEKPRADSSTLRIRGAATGVTTTAAGAAIATAERANSNSARAAAANESAATGIVRGRITDANNTGLEGAMVTVAGAGTGVSTNAAGEYTLGGLVPGARRLTIRRLGYDTVGQDVTIVAGQTTTTDIVLRPAQVALSEVVTTGTAVQKRRAAASADTPPGAPITAAQSNAVGCYELGITPTSRQPRTAFRQVPRRVALESEIVPANADGVWYRARDLSRVGTLPNGLWRPAGPNAVELEWTYGTRTDRVRLSGSPGSMMRGSIEEIDRATAMGEAGDVVAVRRPCDG